MESAGDLLKLWVGLRWTARTIGDDTMYFALLTQGVHPRHQDGGGLGWGKRVKAVSHRSAASSPQPSPFRAIVFTHLGDAPLRRQKNRIFSMPRLGPAPSLFQHMGLLKCLMQSRFFRHLEMCESNSQIRGRGESKVLSQERLPCPTLDRAAVRCDPVHFPTL